MSNPLTGWGNNKLRTDIEAHAAASRDLNLWGAVLALMEDSLLTADEHAAEAKVAAICKTRMHACLARMDKAAARIRKAHP